MFGYSLVETGRVTLGELDAEAFDQMAHMHDKAGPSANQCFPNLESRSVCMGLETSVADGRQQSRALPRRASELLGAEFVTLTVYAVDQRERLLEEGYAQRGSATITS